MQKKLIFLLAFMVLVAIFALQNSDEVKLKLWFWDISTSMVLILILTFTGGAIAGILFSLPRKSKKPKNLSPPPGEKPSEEKPGFESTGEIPRGHPDRSGGDPEFEDVNN
ncbi:lipopolysaccharide assembly LapA domain-containing protein [Bacteroidota bacterium]